MIKGLLVRDLPTLLRVRLTVCRRHGHYWHYDNYCLNCGAPWLHRP